MNWNDPTVKEEFKEALANSSIMHMCESNRNIQSVVSLILAGFECGIIKKWFRFVHTGDFDGT